MYKRNQYDTVIVGGGPSGMAAAISCARGRQKVLLLDRCDKIGKKILVTGNGKCNLTNLRQQPECYRGEQSSFAGDIFSVFGLDQTMELFQKLGIHIKEKNGYVYPYNEQAASVREAFENYLCHLQEKGNLDILNEVSVRDIQKSSGGYLIHVCETETEKKIKQDKKEKQKRVLKKDKYWANSLILATGGLAGVKLGCDGSGYELAKALGHHIIKPLPALTSLKSGAPFLKKLSGVRNQARITLWVEDKKLAEETGELQWTDYGISGVAVFQLSRFAIVALEEKKKVQVSFDFMPELSEKELNKMLSHFWKVCSYKKAESFLNGFLPSKLSPVILREAKISLDTKISLWTEENVKQLGHVLKNFILKINGYTGYEKAQVTRGGVDVSEVTAGMESKLSPGLFFAGEVVDIDGTCGGYNLQWAFSSGSVAGREAYHRNKR